MAQSEQPGPSHSKARSESPSQIDSEEELETSTQPSTPAYFFCIHCSIARSISLEYSGACVYCLEHDQKYCISGDHEADRPDFIDMEGKEQSTCRNCRERDPPGEPSDDETELSQSSDDDE